MVDDSNDRHHDFSHAVLFAVSPPDSLLEHFKHVELSIFFVVLSITITTASYFLERLSSRRALFIIAGTALMLRIFWVCAVSNEQVTDFAIYHELAQAVLSGKGYALTGPVGAEDLELYLGTDKHLPYTTAYRAARNYVFWAVGLFALFGDHVFVFKDSQHFPKHRDRDSDLSAFTAEVLGVLSPEKRRCCGRSIRPPSWRRLYLDLKHYLCFSFFSSFG